MTEAKKDAKTEKQDVEKQVANIAFTVRRIKNWLEEKMGADIDGDGRIGSVPYSRVKKIGLFLLACGLAITVQALPANTNIAVWYPATGTPKTYIDGVGWIHAPYIAVDTQNVTKLNLTTIDVSGTSELGGNVSCLDDFAVSSNSIFSGKTTVNAELEVNVSDIDINIGLAANEIDIDATNTAGTASTPLISITDSRTGSTANETTEATLWMTAAGTYGLVVAGGKTELNGDVLTADDLAVGSNLIVGVNVDVVGTSELGGNVSCLDDLTVASNATFTALTASKVVFTDGSKVLSSTQVTNTLNGSVIIVGNVSNFHLASGIDAAKLLAASIASAFDGSAITNINGTNIQAITIQDAVIGGLGAAKLIAGSTATAISGQSITNLNGTNIQNITVQDAVIGSVGAAKLIAGSVATAISGIAITNIPGTNLLNLSVADGKISDVAGGKITGVRTISGDKITDASITNESIAALAITTGKLAAAVSGQILPTVIATATQAGAGTNNIVFLVKDLAGAAVATNCRIRAWSSATQFGAASSNTALTTAMTGTILKTHTTGCDWDIITTVAGASAIHMVEADATAAITNWINVEVGGFIGSVQSITAIP